MESNLKRFCKTFIEQLPNDIAERESLLGMLDSKVNEFVTQHNVRLVDYKDVYLARFNDLCRGIVYEAERPVEEK